MKAAKLTTHDGDDNHLLDPAAAQDAGALRGGGPGGENIVHQHRAGRPGGGEFLPRAGEDESPAQVLEPLGAGQAGLGIRPPDPGKSRTQRQAGPDATVPEALQIASADITGEMPVAPPQPSGR